MARRGSLRSVVAPSAQVLGHNPDDRHSPRWSGDGLPDVAEAGRLHQIVSHQPRLHERQQMPTRKHVSLDAEPVTSDSALEADGEEAVVFTGQNTNLDCWPRSEVTHRLKCDIGLGALIRLTLGRHLGVDIVQKVRSRIEGAEATDTGRLVLGLKRARVFPPVACPVTGDRDHRVYQHHLANGHPLADERRGKSS